MNIVTTVVIVAKNEIAREGLGRILADRGFSVKAAATGVAAIALEASGRASPDLILVDLASNSEGNDCGSRLRAAFATSRLVLMSDDYSVEAISKSMAAGFDGYVAKDIACEPLVGALRLVGLGEMVVPSQTVSALAVTPWRLPNEDWSANRADVRLSDRETDILRCLTHGDANKLISRELAITEATVKVHIKAILRKLGVANRTQAAMWAVAHGMIGQTVPLRDQSLRVARSLRLSHEASHAI